VTSVTHRRDRHHCACLPKKEKFGTEKAGFVTLFRVPKFTEYALRSLSCLARCRQRMSVRAIAEQERIHPASLAKILHLLCWHGLVYSKRGRRGGFWLARDPAHIRVKQVVEVFQGPLDALSPNGEEGFPAAWESLYAATRKAVETLTLADLLRFKPGSTLPGSAARSAHAGRSHPKAIAGGGAR
jgi:Rrf2 family protein